MADLRWIPASLFLAAAALPALRATGVIDWSWERALAPFTLAGVILLAVRAARPLRPALDALRSLIAGLRGDTPTATPPPDHLEPALAAEAAGERILAEHPELLAALCLGFRMKRFQPTVLGRPVMDPWGVYAAALIASSAELEQVKALARKHTQAYAALGATASGRQPSDAMVMKRAADHFRRCAEKTITRGGPPDCPFEHATVVFGTRSPNRDAQLRSIAPRVRSLLERQYPQLATATLVDGSHVRYTDWKKLAAEERRELALVRRDRDRLGRELAEKNTELAGARARTDALRTDMEQARVDARIAARAEQARALDELRSALERAQQDHARQVHRLESDHAKLVATIEALTAERDSLERALFNDGEESPSPDGVDSTALAGLRVLLVGGDVRQGGLLREFAESHGIRLTHDDSANAVHLVAGADVVVFWIRYLSHARYFAVRRECRVRAVPHGYWPRTSPASLLSVVAQSRAEASVGEK
jgi:hypothetical protein